MPENKTQPTEASLDAFVDLIDDAQKREDTKNLIAMMQEITGEPPVLWGPAIIGFGQCHYKYESGREGDMPLVGFSPRKQNISLYILTGFDDYEAHFAKLGKFKTAKACLYIKKLADVDKSVLYQIIVEAVKKTKETYTCTAGGK